MFFSSFPKSFGKKPEKRQNLLVSIQFHGVDYLIGLVYMWYTEGLSVFFFHFNVILKGLLS